MKNTFKIPLLYNKKTEDIQTNIYHDIDLDEINKQNLYFKLFKPKTKAGEQLLSQWKQKYSYDEHFLKESQKIYTKLKISPTKNNDKIYNIWKQFKNQENFYATYNFIEWNQLKFLNEKSLFLQLVSINTLISPILTLLFPIMIAFIPFFILKFKNIKIDFKSYLLILQTLLTKHPIGKLFNWNKNTMEQNAYSCVGVCLYLFQIYQNIKSCITFCNNMNQINTTIDKLKTYIDSNINKMSQFIDISKKFKSYKKFNKSLTKIIVLAKNNKKILDTVPTSTNKITQFINIGNALKIYCYLYENTTITNVINYMNNFNGYLDHIEGLQENIHSKKINKCKYKLNHLEFNDIYYGQINKTKSVVNSFKIDHNYIITGPNASGKTTILKATLSNIILSQQVGFGFYKNATLNCFKYIHCYLNIPDTSERDSLFQAEARRCKTIIDNIETIKKDKIFCIFDELYSGTNPKEAIASAKAFLNYLSNKTNVTFMITTHYNELCNDTTASTNKNYCMKINTKHKNLTFTYKLIEGINTTKGGVNVLKQLNYPKNIINATETILANSFNDT